MVVILSRMTASMNAQCSVSQPQLLHLLTAGYSIWHELREARPPGRPALLVSQRVNRIEIRRLPRRVNPEDQANHARDGKSDHRPHGGHGRRQGAYDQTNQQSKNSPNDNADDTA